MRPFFTVFGYRVAAFALMAIAASVVAFGILLLCTRGKSHQHDAVNYFFFAACGAIVGAWGLYVMLNFPLFIGAVFYGGLIGGIFTMWAYSKLFCVPLLPFMDLFAPILLVTHAIGRVGCFLAGCCYGVEVGPGHLLAVVYPEYSLGAPDGVYLLAVPLIEAAANLLIALVLFLRVGKHRPGIVAALYMMAYAGMRFVLEFYRGDAARGILLGLSTSQWISIGVFISGLCCYIKSNRNRVDLL